MNAEQEHEVRVISERIARTEMARALIDAGKYDKALVLLQKIKDSYSDPDKKKMVQHLIHQALEKQAASRGIIEKITGRFKRPSLETLK